MRQFLLAAAAATLLADAPRAAELPPPVVCSDAKCSNAGQAAFGLIAAFHAMTRAAESVRAADPVSANDIIGLAGVCMQGAESIYQADAPPAAAVSAIAKCNQAIAAARAPLEKARRTPPAAGAGH